MPQVFQGSASYPQPSPGPVLTIGNFDGVHRGHAHLVGRVVELAREHDVPACAFTFEPPPRAVLQPERRPPRILGIAEKIERLGALGIDQVVVETFDLDFAEHPPDWFLRTVLAERLQPSRMVVGHDFRFGKGRAGNIESVRAAFPELPLEQVGALQVDGTTASSSRVRELVALGELEQATALLGRHYGFDGEVVHGEGMGHGLGFPTANLHTDAELLPAGGVYAAELRLGDAWLPAVANLGVRPTFDGRRFAIEVHVLDFDGDLYDQRVRVRFVRRLRGEQRFSGPDALKAQIARDVRAAREALSA